MMQYTRLKIEAVLAQLCSAQADIERALYARELMDSMGAPSDAQVLANEALGFLQTVFDKIEEAKAQLTISGK